MDSEFMTPSELAERLQVTKEYLSQRRYMGDGPPFQKLSPKVVRYRRRDVDEWLEGRRLTQSETGVA